MDINKINVEEIPIIYNIKVTPKLSTAVQKCLFAIGYDWSGAKKQTVQYTDKPYLCIWLDGAPTRAITYSYKERLDNSNSPLFNEISAKPLVAIRALVQYKKDNPHLFVDWSNNKQ